MDNVIYQCIREEKNDSCSISSSKKRDGEQGSDVETKIETVSLGEEGSKKDEKQLNDGKDDVADEIKSLESMRDEKKEAKDEVNIGTNNMTLQETLSNKLKMKTEEDFLEEVVEIKLENMNLLERIEAMGRKQKLIEVKIEKLRANAKDYVIQIENAKKLKTNEEVEQDREDEAHVKILEVLLGKNTELNNKLAEILEETDETLEEYKKDNKDLRIKLWKAI